MLDWIDLEGVGWLRLTELEADEKKKRGCADFLELDRFELGGILALCPVYDVGKCHGCHLTAYFASPRADHATHTGLELIMRISFSLEPFKVLCTTIQSHMRLLLRARDIIFV